MTGHTESDLLFMRNALELARQAKGKTFPNPAVGAVVVLDGRVVGTGATQVYGGPHAEKVALLEAADKAKGASLYVTLEPCCHFGRTPPCTDAIIKAGISRVFIAVTDPNPLVSGKGIQQLRDHNIEVCTGLLQQDAEELNEDFFWSIQTHRAWVTLKLAMTLDGRIADSTGKSKWITNSTSRDYVHELRRCHAAIGVGRGTLEADNPQLTVRHKEGYNPARIIFSSETKLSEESYFYQHASEARSIVVVRGGDHIEIIKKAGIEYWYTGETDRLQNLKVFTELAYQQHLSSIFIEGGQQLGSQFLEAGLVNRVYLFYGCKIVGEGKDGISFNNGLPIHQSITLSSVKHQVFGTDFVISGIPLYGAKD